ncbi:DUF2264 domain-containing protein [Psychromicrobium xiongbiense]|uniref:DUF2264 domain-containing protein n=1 Tax=Psychromicrobium xiongbiense TaxID=3051184 RepID=UPI0025531411|nr:DUF2264 domain-containing protein [Psychromicrobium sp. YIM S02556]
MQLPDPDLSLSPLTGWTRQHWLVFADAQLLAVRPYAMEDHALINLPGRTARSGYWSDGLEGFARTFLLASFRVAGERGSDPHGYLESYRRGLVAGVRGGWPPMTPRSQPQVEAASIAIGLYLTKEWLWETLSEAEQAAVARWLFGSNDGPANDNNWVLFQVVVAEFLAGVGYDYNPEHLQHGFRRLEDWYVGGGWYRDGDGDYFDYYCAWAMHLYPVLWLRMAEARDPERVARLRPVFGARLAEFLPDHAGFFGSSGSPVYQGRSLIYRYAAVAPFFAAALLGLDAEDAPADSGLRPGQIRRIASGAARFFVDHGAYRTGLPTMGWFHEFQPMTQDYSGPASPFWSSKAFVGLLLPTEHPVWTAVEEPMPVERADRRRIATGPNFLLASTADDGVARVLNHGSDKYYGPALNDDPAYSRLAYSSHTAPLYHPAGPLDNHVAVLDEYGTASRRLRIHRLPARAGSLASYYRPVWGMQDPEESPWRISTVTATTGGYEVRLHLVEYSGPEVPGEGMAVLVREGGYPLADHQPESIRIEERAESASVSTGSLHSVSSLHSVIWRLWGYESVAVSHAVGVSPLAMHSAVPLVEGHFTGRRTVFASLVYLGGAAPRTAPGEVRCVDHGDRVWLSVTLGDGTMLEAELLAS